MKEFLKNTDWHLLLFFLFIPFLSLIVLYSAGYNENTNIKILNWLPFTIKSEAFFKQLINITLAFFALILGYFINLKKLQKFSFFLYLLMVCFLIAVLIIGITSKGSQRWIPLGFFRFQPSEFSKCVIIIIIAYFIAKVPPKPEGYDLKSLIVPLILILIPTILILIQPDLGTALSVFAISFSMLLFAGIRKKILIMFVIFAIILSIPAWNFILKPYQQKRVLTLFNPEADPLGTGYHIIQSKIAVGSGGITGKGFRQGTQTQLEFLPENTTDFIFSVLSEEWGFLGSGFVLFCYFVFISSLIKLAKKCRDPFYVMIVFGFASYLTFHLFVNIGMVIGIMPVVGLPLPLFSYGGSALLMVFFIQGLILNISYSRKRI